MKYIGYLCAIIISCLSARAAAQAGADTYHVVKGNNGQTYLLAQAATGGVVYTDVYFRIGTAYETDSMSGVCMLLLRSIDHGIGQAIAGRSIRYQSELTPTQFGFHFQSSGVEDVAPVIRDQIFNAQVDEATLLAVRGVIQAALDSMQRDEAARTAYQIKKVLWSDDILKLDVYGDRSTYRRIRADQVNIFHDKYFLPLNNAVVVTGTFAEQAVVDRLQTAFKDFRRMDFNPELITHVINFKPTIASVQLLSMEPGVQRLSLSYQQPGARQDRAGSYCAYMLSALANDPQSKLGRALAAGGLLSHVQAAYDCNNFQGTFTLTADIPSGRYQEAFLIIDSALAAVQRKDFLTTDDLMAEQKKVKDEFNTLRSQTHTFMLQVARYRFNNDEFYFSTLADSIVSVDVPAMRRYMTDYFADRVGVRCVYTDTAVLNQAPAATRYYALDDSIGNVTFSYPQNVTDIDSGSYTSLYRLIQWLKVNPDIYVQVNGYSDKGEYVKAYDTTVINFIRNTPTFRKAMPDNIKANYLRIEMMRAMKIVKAIYEAGIEERRISGTSMSFSSEEGEQVPAFRKCTVTLEKIRPHISLYEYHFGHKKQ